MLLWLLVLIQIAVGGARADERPQWTFKPPRADSQYKYYVGRALAEATEGDAWRVAKDQAQESAVRENYGVETSIASSSYESSKQVAIDKRVSEAFPKVRLIDFEQIDSFVEERDEKFSVWVMFRYPLRQILLERERLQAEQPEATAAFNEVGKPELNYSTLLEVTSEPAGVPVFIDSERWGVTPLRVAGVMESGLHKIRLSHSNFQDIHDEVVLVKGATKRVHHQMRPAKGYLKVSSEPANATVILDGITKGSSPAGPFEVIAGRPTKVELRLGGYETQIQIVEVQKDEIRRLQFNLNQIRKPEPKYEYSISENSSEEDIEDEDVQEIQRRSAVDPQNIWIFGFLLGLSGPSAPSPYGLSTAQMGFSAEKRFWSILGIRGAVTYDFATETTKTSKYSNAYALEGTGYLIGLPIYLSTSSRGFYLMPELGLIKHKRIKEQSNLNSSSSSSAEYLELSSQRRGLRLGYMNIDSNIDIWVAGHEYDWLEWGKVYTASGGITFTLNFGGF